MMNEQFSKTIYGFSEGNCPEMSNLKPDCPSSDCFQTVIRRALLYFTDLFICWYHLQGVDCIYIWVFLDVTFFVLSHQEDISDSEIPISKGQRWKYFARSKSKSLIKDIRSKVILVSVTFIGFNGNFLVNFRQSGLSFRKSGLLK